MKTRIVKLFVLLLFVLAGVAVLSGTSGRAQQQQEKTVEQTRKNIQVLKGLPESQLFTVMNFMRDSLGVSCAYCHVNAGGDKWEWESDAKPEKVTARKMMLMQFDINKENHAIFGATAAVNCYTCHRGQTKPATLMPLPQGEPAGGPAGEKAKGEAAALPAAEQVIAKYEQAIGGRAAFEKLKSRVMKGSQVTSDGTALPLEIDQVAPDKLVAIVTMPRGTMMSGYNGATGWMKNPRGLREMSGGQLTQMKRASAFLGGFMFREMYPGMVVTGKEKIGEREAYVVTSRVSDTRTERLYFDTETGLLLRILAITQTTLAPIPEQTDYEDYRVVDGVKLPFTVRQSYVDPWNGWTRKFTEIKHNVPVDETRFNMPPAPAAPPATK
ncbi:MAG TPA: c-type cytochrome [Pyrinomonadaceae bacterium]